MSAVGEFSHAILGLSGPLDTVPHHFPNKRLAPFYSGIHQ